MGESTISQIEGSAVKEATVINEAYSQSLFTQISSVLDSHASVAFFEKTSYSSYIPKISDKYSSRNLASQGFLNHSSYWTLCCFGWPQNMLSIPHIGASAGHFLLSVTNMQISPVCKEKFSCETCTLSSCPADLFLVLFAFSKGAKRPFHAVLGAVFRSVFFPIIPGLPIAFGDTCCT